MTVMDLENPSVDESFIREALKQADLNAVRLAVYQITKDPALATMRVGEKSLWGGFNKVSDLAPEHHEEVAAKALDLLLKGPIAPPPTPDMAERRRLMEMFLAKPVSDNVARLGSEELAFDDPPRRAHWTNRPSEEVIAKHHVVIIGCGICGIAAGVNLTRLGIPYTILEKGTGPGGTWYHNSYPEARTDIASVQYQFKFEKNFDWKDTFPSQAEMLRYLNHIIDKYGVRPNARFSSEVLSATWNDDTARWLVGYKDESGTERQVEGNFLLNATGQFQRPNVPDIAGLDDFEGKVFHSARWDHSVELAGKRVALIGNGSTGVQMTGAVADVAESLSVFIRTPNWVYPIEGYRDPVPAHRKWLFDNLPNYWNWYGFSTWSRAFEFQLLTVYDYEWMAKGGQISERNDKLRSVLSNFIWEKMVDKPELIDFLTPKYAPLARRLIADNNWYDTLNKDNVEVVTSGIDHFTSDGITTADSRHRDFDVAILSCGFRIYDYGWPIKYQARGGKSLSDIWSEKGPRAYYSMMVPEFPNFFMFYGPNSSPRSSGFHTWSEVWARYASTMIVHIIENGLKSVEVREEAYERYNERIDQVAKGSFRGGSESQGSYHINAWGRAGVNMPLFAPDWHAEITSPNFGELIIR